METLTSQRANDIWLTIFSSSDWTRGLWRGLDERDFERRSGLSRSYCAQATRESLNEWALLGEQTGRLRRLERVRHHDWLPESRSLGKRLAADKPFPVRKRVIV